MADLEYDATALIDLGEDMRSLAGDLRSDGHRSDHARSGHRAVAAALDRFAGEWDDKRETLARNLEKIGALASESGKTFSETDRELAALLVESAEGGR
ncbi:hypothetical protein F0U44_05645 [Nocardioides humilatus]|uniref:Uncharacterized protein n=1 Tax=Nocardioides humilatus TaxID=2607660 RepID=A0A5B1LMK3_9ACTN|nr:hypothetical protein [Nocardioides humilatus]KAA1421754.1 hypothetical protein F0U44_05645 [Nocardioides humilatus]